MNGTTRARYIEGLRDVADLLESRPDLPLPLPETFSVFCEDKETAAEWVRAFPGPKDKSVNGDETHMIFGRQHDVFGPHGFNVWIARGQVCERVVTGTREITETVPAPDAPMVEVTRTVEDVEWVCAPLLAEAAS